jgi:hypothetical protein
MGNRSAGTIAVLRYMRAKPGQYLYFRDIAADLNQDIAKVNNSLSQVVRSHPEYGVRRVGQGQYVFKPELQGEEVTTEAPVDERPETHMYEGVGVTQDGTRVIRDENGVLWKLSERL